MEKKNSSPWFHTIKVKVGGEIWKFELESKVKKRFH